MYVGVGSAEAWSRRSEDPGMEDRNAMASHGHGSEMGLHEARYYHEPKRG